ncbi:MAG: L-glutamate gamma-semialdehyde dehydrogenase [Candidatus Dormibacteraeota bacterium]|uniref:L-glutamate gamma-semialdehyde dehydrogenase n=1 Tax=Candidatus Dormiibacter inghamiae TaxID=3127013 RepID=A0A934KEW7_9BACT|nr:L-glutamate gamma-semialdehyde dehydrogenase [Candidatus Dormibacteraeota bacterium]MBJ7604980.1 L-glutamate gamma-semialdehyde dehydrogenase [Candidatus Dormibacteraeota bacterium]
MSAPGIFQTPDPYNEPIRSYAPGSPERTSLRAKLKELSSRQTEMPLIIGGKDVNTGRTFEARMPHRRSHVLGTVQRAGEAEMHQAIAAARKAWPEWSRLAWTERAAIFLRAAELLAGPWRDVINASTMLGQSKTAHQAEIDAACELCDFLRYNVAFLERIYAEQPESSPGVWNRLEYRPLEGFTLAVTPFNFTSIAGNLPTAPALMGGTVVWKPAETAALSNHFLMRLWQAAGLPDGVINLVHGPGAELVPVALESPELAGIHFTGSTAVFRDIWRRTAEKLDAYRNYPRLVGETGGKDFIVAHPSAEPEAVATAILRGSFEYQGQKCSAASRVFVPESLWQPIREQLADEVASIPVGDVADFRNFMGAVINQASFERQKGAIQEARAKSGHEVLVGGKVDDSEGWFVSPTVVVTQDTGSRLLRDELFGPVVTVNVFPDGRYAETLDLIETSAPYGLTGAVFAQDRKAVELAHDRLLYAAGNFYVNDKPTGAVVGQQPFGGSRASGTNDKAGSMWNLTRWVTPRTVKETFVPASNYRYPYMDADEDRA